MDEAALKKQLKEQDFCRAYLLYGEEPWLVRHYAERIAKKSVDGAFEEFNLQRFDEEASVDQIAEAVEALPMMSERKCVVVKNYDAETNASQTAKMEELLSDLPQSCVLVFAQTTREVPLKKSAKWRAFVKAVSAAGGAVEFPMRDGAALNRFLTSFAQERGCVLSPETAKYIVSVCGGGLTQLSNEMEKICAFAGGGELRREHVDAVCSRAQDTASYRMANALTAGDYDTAYRLLDVLLYRREEPVALLAAVSSAYVDLYRARAALESGQTTAEIAGAFDYGKMDFKLKNAARGCKRYDLGQLRRCLELLFTADRELKSSRVAPRVILEKTMAGLLLISAQRAQ